jgi:hypothetical protein
MFNGIFITYVVYEVVLQFLCGVYASYQLFVAVRFSPESRWSLPTFILILIVIAAIRMYPLQFVSHPI